MPVNNRGLRAYRSKLLALSAALGTTLAAPAGAQTLFAWPDTTVDVATYRTIEECQAVVSRSRQTVVSSGDLATGIWRDTMPSDSRERKLPVPVPVAGTAQRCLARFAAVESMPVTSFSVLMPLYLQAGWDDKAKAIMERRIAAVTRDKNADAELAAVIDTAVQISLGRGPGIGVRPPRLAMALEIVDKYLPQVADRLARLSMRVKLMSHGAFSGDTPDTAQLDRVVAQIAAIVDSLTAREREKLEEEYGIRAEGGDFAERHEAQLKMSLDKRVFRDSLRQSTAALVAMRRARFAKMTGLRPEAFPIPIGERAPPINGEIWLGRENPSPRPVPGRVSLMVFLSHGECTNPSCAEHLVPLRRLAARFPALEITIVAETRGYFMYLKESITPLREAELTKQWLESFGVTAPLAMSVTQAWHLPEPDARRLSRATDNRTNYSFGETWKPENGRALLVDENGIIAHADGIVRVTEVDFADLIEVLLERQVAKR